MAAEGITLTREDLYNRVWSTPIQKLAKEYGLSDVGLAKLCRRHEIPVPVEATNIKSSNTVNTKGKHRNCQQVLQSGPGTTVAL